MSRSAKFVFLHLACAIRRPKNWRFHTAGALREVNRLRPALRSAIASMFALL
jgi:hypothetical protein